MDVKLLHPVWRDFISRIL